MTHTYTVTGMTCGSCVAKVRDRLLALPHVTGVDVSKERQSATISMDKHVPLSTLQESLDKKYSLTAMEPLKRQNKLKAG